MKVAVVIIVCQSLLCANCDCAQFELVFNRAILNVMPTVSSEYEEGGAR